MKNVCPGLEDWAAFLDGRLDGAAREAAERHLADCAACRAELKEFSRVLQDVAKAEEAAPPGLSSRILQAAGVRTRRRGLPARRRPLWAVGLAAAAVVVAAVGLLWPRPSPPPVVEAPRVVVPLPPAPPVAKRPDEPPPPPVPEPPSPKPEKAPPPPPVDPPAPPAPPPPPKPPEPESPKPPSPAPPPELKPPPARTRTALARVQAVQGKVSLLDAGAVRPCPPDSDLLPEAGLQTAVGASAVLAFPDGTALELGPSTTIRVLDLEGQDGAGKRVELEAGRLEARIAKQPAGRAMVFVTPHAEARVLGTTLRLSLIGAKSDTTRLEVVEGKVRLKKPDGKGVDVGPGQFALAAPGVEPAPRRVSSLVLHWKLDDGQGTLARDASGNGHDGVIAGEPGWTSGHAGGAFHLLKARIDSPALELPELRAYTLAFWVSQETLPGYQDAYAHLIPGAVLIREANMGTGRLRASLKTDTAAATLAFDAVVTKARQWTHVALAWDGAEALLYRNGKDVAKAKLAGRALAPQGFIARLGGSEKLDAKVDDLRLYRRALSEPEIREVMAGGTVR